MPKDEGREIITSLEGGEVQVDGTSAAGVPEKFLCSGALGLYRFMGPKTLFLLRFSC